MRGNGTAVFRADASIDIGTGHVMRCLTLADRLRECGVRCRFVSRDHRGALTALVSSRGHDVDLLPAGPASRTDGPAHEAWLGSEWRADAQQTLDAIGRALPDWLVVDHYGVDARWEALLRPACERMLVIDDLADRSHVCDVLLDQNLGHDGDSYASLVPPDCSVLAGPTYALLRPEFVQWRARSLAHRGSAGVHRILVTMGGMDKDNATGAALKALAACHLPAGCRVQVVLGPQAPWFEQIRTLAATLPLAVEVIPGTDEMARLMAESDLVIGGAGSTSWERCALGAPSILVVLADNQRNAAAALSAAGAALVIDPGTPIEKSIAAALATVLGDPRRLSELSYHASLICDGLGTQRVADYLLGRD